MGDQQKALDQSNLSAESATNADFQAIPSPIVSFVRPSKHLIPNSGGVFRIRWHLSIGRKSANNK
jgi:hypothetical protein